MWVNVPSTKTLTRDKCVSIPVYKIPTSVYCPVQACIDAMTLTPASRDAPIFISPYSGKPLTATEATKLLRVALTILQHPDASQATVHLTRHSGAAGCASAGVSESDVRRHGTWKSSASRVYAPKRLYTDSSKVIATLLK